jgi:outer membrane murein-binding lipoprotein Lpp
MLRRRVSGGVEVDVSDSIAFEAWDLSAAIDRLRRAVQHLEAVLVEHEQAAHEQAQRLHEMRREAEALRALQNTVANHLDAAIARLKETIGN